MSCTDPSNKSLRYFRVFRNMIKLHSLYSSPPLINALNDDDIDAQIYRWHIMTEVSSNLVLKTIHSSFVTKHLNLALRQWRRKTFLNYLDVSDWHLAHEGQLCNSVDMDNIWGGINQTLEIGEAHCNTSNSPWIDFIPISLTPVIFLIRQWWPQWWWWWY